VKFRSELRFLARASLLSAGLLSFSPTQAQPNSKSPVAAFLEAHPDILFTNSDISSVSGTCPLIIETGKGHFPRWMKVIDWSRIQSVKIYPNNPDTVVLHGSLLVWRKLEPSNKAEQTNGTVFHTSRANAAQLLKLLRENRSACGGRPGPDEAPEATETNPEDERRTDKAAERSSADRGKSETSPKPTQTNPVSTGPTPNQLKYQRELEAYKARLEEIDKIKSDTAARHASNQAAAKQVLGVHDQDLARHKQEVAAAEAAKRRYEQELADHQRLVEQMRTKEDKARLVEWREAVVVCTLNSNDGQSKFGNWRCDGPLQFTYAKLGTGGASSQQTLTALSQACGGRRESVRDLGTVASARLFGCSFGLHPNATSGFHQDAAAKHGIAYVPGRAIYRCPASQSYCRTK